MKRFFASAIGVSGLILMGSALWTLIQTEYQKGSGMLMVSIAIIVLTIWNFPEKD